MFRGASETQPAARFTPQLSVRMFTVVNFNTFLCGPVQNMIKNIVFACLQWQ